MTVKKRGREWLKCSGDFVYLCVYTYYETKGETLRQSYEYFQLDKDKLQGVGLSTN